MEAPCCIPALAAGNSACRVSVWDGTRLSRLHTDEKDDIKNIIDGMGRLSAFSQRLRMPITDYDRICLGSQKLYLLTSCGPAKGTILVKGLLKVGFKNLFIRKECGALVEINPLCVLDFYIHVSCQRMGLGRQIFEAMLSSEKKLPHQIGYDRPSQKLLSFLAKHYSMKRYYPQANQFVIFNAYFDSTCEDKMEIQSRLCDCIKANNRSCNVAFLDTPRVKKDVLHGRRANKSSPEKDAGTVEGKMSKEAPTTPSIALRRRPLLQDDEVREVPSVAQVFPEQLSVLAAATSSHYDWMTGTRKTTFLKPTDSAEEFSFSSRLSQEHGPPSSRRDAGGYDSDRGRFFRGKAQETLSRQTGPQSPRSNLRAQLSGTGAAAALGFKQA